MGLVKLTYENYKAVRQMRTHIRLLAQPKSMYSIIDATQREQRYASAWNWCVNRDCVTKQNPNPMNLQG